MPKYFGNFTDIDSVNGNFGDAYYYEGRAETPPQELVSDEQVLYAHYGMGSYEGDALVIFEEDGKLFEVNGGHCSCYGLEGQWKPEETSWQALAIRKFYTCGNDSDLEPLRELIREHTR